MRYAAFLRGINVGGNKKVPMAQLKSVLEATGFSEVKTLLNSGNVTFDAKKEKESSLAKKIAARLETEFGFPVPVIVRSAKELEDIANGEPFKEINVTKETRLYVTFLPEPHMSKMKLPYVSADNSFRIFRLDKDTVYSVLDVSKTGTPEAMSILGKEFGKNITTRNWNTVVKLSLS